MSAAADSIQPLGSSDPATIFISYARGDEEAVLPLERALQERGIKVLRDKPSLTLGAHNIQALTRLIDIGCDGILFFMTDKLLRSNFIWRHEIPTAIARQKREPNFHLIPVLLGIDYDELALVCADRGLPSLANFNAERMDTGILTPADIARIARRTLQSALVLRMARDQDETIGLVLRTFEFTPSAASLHLDINWMTAFSGDGPPPQMWQTTLLPALADATNALAQAARGRTVDCWLKARLPVGLALGYMIPPKGTLRLRLCNEEATWACFGPGEDANGLIITPTALGGQPSCAIVEIAVSREITKVVTAWRVAEEIVPAWRVRFAPASGPSRDALASEGMARAWARSIGNELRRLWDSEGVREVHLFIASSIEFAVMVGQQLRDRFPVHVYFANRDGQYQRAYTLGEEQS